MDGFLRHAQNSRSVPGGSGRYAPKTLKLASRSVVHSPARPCGANFTGSVFSPESCERSAQIDCRASASPSRTWPRVVSSCFAAASTLLLPQQLGQHFQLHRDAHIALRQRVVNLARNAIAFAQHGVELALRTQQPPPQQQRNQARHRSRQQNVEPDRLVEMRPQFKLQRRALAVFHTPSLLAACTRNV